MSESPNLVLVVLDTMRKDVLKLYGGQARAPGLEKLAMDGVVYPRCVASSPWTVPSHASLFTGLLPSRHGAHETREKKIGQVFGSMARVEAETLSSYLGERGYATYCYSANANIAPGSGFERGFDSFFLMNISDPDERTKEAIDLARKYGNTRREVTLNMIKKGRFGDLARLFQEDRKLKREHRKRNYPRFKGGDAVATSISGLKLEEPFFLFVNLLEMHEPYISGEAGQEPRPSVDLFGKRKIGESLMGSIRRKYAEEVGVVDGFLSKVVEWLRASGSYDRSMVVVTSDHGQALKEHGYYGHGAFMYDEILEVPLVVKYPGGAKPKPGLGYQPLHRIQEVMKDWMAGEKDGSGLESDHAVSESFGVHFGLRVVKDVPGFEEKRERFDRPRKAVYRGGFKLVVDGKEGKVEEFTQGGMPASVSDRRVEFNGMVEDLRRLGDPDFVLPEQAKPASSS